ncbi:MAG: hypothetical protein LUC98_01805 [Lachnospiraceae bacterium]|nr:hypothetical protein [Lachnospiraceae bacterium]
MAGGVSVERAAIQGGMNCCKASIHELETAARSLRQNYQRAGANGWKDQKYTALGGIVNECCTALIKPVDELQDCLVKLNDLMAAVVAYESTSIY